ncbi:hypothetical protein BCF89_10545 [Metamycoplasma auris]|uniref:Uncharacterized protein n=1 Tax=Metamycoplasma auris TaxID=51363 RepID=A0A2W7G025_9BACT|nr:hypothetical protein BCF89_10545 [Metamycoplasma auris]
MTEAGLTIYEKLFYLFFFFFFFENRKKRLKKIEFSNENVDLVNLKIKNSIRKLLVFINIKK